MDVPISPELLRRRRRQRWLLASGVLAVSTLATLGLSRLQPALPSVDEDALYVGTVQRGDLVCQVRGSGSLVPEQTQFVQAETGGRIERILVQPGTAVAADTLLMELANPELEQAAFDAEWQVKGAEARLVELRARLTNDQLALKSSIAALKAESVQAELDVRVDEDLALAKLTPALEAQRSRARADALRERHEIEQQRLQASEESTGAQLAVQQAEVERARAQLARKRQQVAALRVQGGVDGVLQQIGDSVPLQIGQWVTPGTTLAKVVEPTRLKAVLRIPETQAKDLQLDQAALIDTRNGTVPGRVVRIDPAAQNGTVTVEVELQGQLPKGARPELSVDGLIELERLASVLYVGRPVHGQADSTVSLFKLLRGGAVAEQVPVRLGHSSVSVIEVVEGLEAGDRVILSDMTAWHEHERVRLQ